MSGETPIPITNERTPPRSAVACNACRTRKQKCGGEKPKCTRCRQLNIDCSWPEKLKRGPAKGYTEALEARLSETEEVLLKALSCVSSEEFERVMGERPPVGDGGVGGSGNGNGSERTSVLERKEVMENWARWPLGTEERVKGWFEWRMGDGDGGFKGLGEGKTRLGGEVSLGEGVERRAVQEGAVGIRTSGYKHTAALNLQSQHHYTQGKSVSTSMPLVHSSEEGGNDEIEGRNICTSVNGFGMSRQFQQDFLW